VSVREILAELPKLTADELAAVDGKLREIHGENARPPQMWGQALLEIAGTAEGLPTDFAENHDHYLHGTPKR
jgi:hypothetical protein